MKKLVIFLVLFSCNRDIPKISIASDNYAKFMQFSFKDSFFYLTSLHIYIDEFLIISPSFDNNEIIDSIYRIDTNAIVILSNCDSIKFKSIFNHKADSVSVIRQRLKPVDLHNLLHSTSTLPR
jgi:hypothetical protein